MRIGRVVGGWFALVVLYTVVTKAEAVSGVLGGATTALQRLSDPNVALIPDRTGKAPTGLTGPVTATTGVNVVPGTSYTTTSPKTGPKAPTP